MADSSSGVTRRDFLVATSVTSTAVLIAGPAQAAPAAADGAKAPGKAVTLGPGDIPVSVLVNGSEQKVRVRPGTTLVEVLRDQLLLTGTKIGCDRGACGACTVWIDGQASLSCMTLALDVAGLSGPASIAPRAITTIEGLARGEALHPVQAAFVEQDALQCGFCTPGMVMSCAALVEHRWKDGKPLDEAGVREAVSGNLCRCGTYPNVIAATLLAHKRPSSPIGPSR